MKACYMPMCGNDSSKRPDLRYFTLPKDVNVREEWLEVIGMKDFRGHNLSICELHFKDLDFCAGKKALKIHAVPVRHMEESIGDEDNFISSQSEYQLENLEALETDEIPNTSSSNAKKKPKLELKEEPSEAESETGRRPSRRAALVAAKKIFNTINNNGLTEQYPEVPSSIKFHPKAQSSPRKTGSRQRHPSIDLEMHCEDDGLSEAQIRLQNELRRDFIQSFQNFKDLSRCKNVRIIQEEEPIIDFSLPVEAYLDNGYDARLKSVPKASMPKVLPKPVLPKVEAAQKPTTRVIYL